MASSSPSEQSAILPRVLVVSRRTVRKNKFVDFVGEYHLDLIVRYGAVPVIVPRVSGVHLLLASFEPIHGVLLCEGEDIDPSLYRSDASALSQEELEKVRRLHVSDTIFDREKDLIELRLAKLCLERNIPFLGICRGSQVLNVACGGTLYQDIEMELSRKVECPSVHIDYDNYDGHRHPVTIVEGTPLHSWFSDSLNGERMEIQVNSYHHQGVRRLAERFIPMAFASDGLIEGFYDPNVYNPEEGRFIMGLQFHPERMRQSENDEFDYPGCPFAYKEFVKAVIAYQKKVTGSIHLKNGMKLDHEIERTRRVSILSFCVARGMYSSEQEMPTQKELDLESGTKFLESSPVLSTQQEGRLKQMGATVRNASAYWRLLRRDQEREVAVRKLMEKMSLQQLSELLSFYHQMRKICSEVLERQLASS